MWGLPPATPPAGEEEREAGEVEIRWEREGEREVELKKKEENEGRRRGAASVFLKKFHQTTGRLLPKESAWTNPNDKSFGFTRTTGRPKTWQTTRRFPFIRTTSRSIRTNDTPFDPARERLCTPRQTTRRLLPATERLVVRPFLFQIFIFQF